MVSTYSVGSHGYCQIGWYEDGKARMTLVHRVVWLAAHGPIPGGLVVDHTCFNRRCGLLDHLRLLTRAVNAGLNSNSRKTHCKRGHEFTVDNIYRSAEGHRLCRTCVRAAQARAVRVARGAI